MIDHNGAWLPSVWLGLPAIGLALLVCVFLTFVAFWSESGGGKDAAAGCMLACVPLLAVLALVVIPLFGYWPYKGDYHRLQPISGVVASVDSRFLAASQYVVVTYREGETVRCDDSRCATVKVGDQLRLLCTKEFEYGAVNGWGCRWGQP